MEQHHRSLNEYDLPALTLTNSDLQNELPKLIMNELNISTTTGDLAKTGLFNIVIDCIEKNKPNVIFVDGPAGILKLMNSNLLYN